MWKMMEASTMLKSRDRQDGKDGVKASGSEGAHVQAGWPAGEEGGEDARIERASASKLCKRCSWLDMNVAE